MAKAFFPLVARIGEASNPGPSRPPLMAIKHASHWIADDSDDGRSSGHWSVEEMYGGQEEPQLPQSGCQWHHLGEASDNDVELTGARPENALDDPEGDSMSESSQRSEGTYQLGLGCPSSATQRGGAPHEESADFIRPDKFKGARCGYHFKKGEKGLGYYRECPVAITIADEVFPGH